ncbi:MAG: MFS transporter [Dehalococcoidia bacterium]
MMAAAQRANRRTPLSALLAATSVSQVGNVLSFLAIPWFVLQVTGSPARAGITVATGALPVIAGGIFGGALVDRFGARRMSILADLASSAAVALVPLLYHTVGLAFWQLLVLVFLGALLDSPGITARRSIYPDLARDAGVSLERANALYQVILRTALLVGPPLAGILIATIGASNLLWLNAASFVVSAGIVALAVRVRQPHEQTVRDETPGHFLGEIAEGFRFIRRDPVLLALTITTSVGSLLAEPLYSVVLPVYAREVFGSAIDLGLMFAALAAGSLAGNAVFWLVGPRLPRRATIIAGFTVRALTLWVLVFLPPLWVIVVSIVINALCLEPVNPMAMTIAQERIPAAMRGRVVGTVAAIAAMTLPLGMLVYGWLLEAIGLQPTLLVLAVVNLALPVTMLFLPGLRMLTASRPAAPSMVRPPEPAGTT